MAHVDLTTPRLLLRATRDTDCEPLTAILQEPAVARRWPGYDSQQVREELIEATGTTVLAIEERPEAAGAGGAVIGAIQYYENPDPEYRHAGIDLFLGTRWHGRGLGSEAIAAVIAHLFGPLSHHRITIDPAADNERAIRTYERLGFRRVGLLRQYERGPDGTFHDGVQMELLAADYRPPRPPAPPVSSPVSLRTASEADVPMLLAMMVAFNQGESIAWDPRAGEAPLRHLLRSPDLGVVSVVSLLLRPVGYAVVTYGYDLEFGGCDAFLTELFLTPETRGRGVGRQALERLLDEVRRHGAGALHLQVRPDNPAAMRLYLEAGFKTTTRVFLSRELLRESKDQQGG